MNTANSAMIDLRDVTKTYQMGDSTVHALDGVTMTIERGEFVAITGPSGSGKSTLMNILGCLDRPTEGSYQLDGDEVATLNDDQLAVTRNKKIGFVFQNFNLLPRISAIKNIALPLVYAGTNDADRMQQALVMLGKVGIAERKNHRPNELSGGQRQRVAIGRAIVRNPKVFLFDEPLSNLDAELRVEMRLHIAKLHQELKTTMIYVTHDQIEAMTLADKIVVMNYGKVEQVGSPMDLYYKPVNQFVAGFIGSPKMNFLPAQVISWSPSQLELALSEQRTITLPIITNELAAGSTITLGLRPEHLVPGGDGIHLSFTCEVVERLGNSTYLFGQCCGIDGFKLLLPGDNAFKPYQQLDVFFSPEHCLVFAADGTRISR